MSFSKYKKTGYSLAGIFSMVGTSFSQASEADITPKATSISVEIAYENLIIADGNSASTNAASLEGIGLSSQEITTLDTANPDPKAVAKIRAYAENSSESQYSKLSSEDRLALARYIMISNLDLSLNFETIGNLLKASLLRSKIELPEFDNVKEFLRNIIEGKPLYLKNKKALNSVREVFAKLDNAQQLESQFLMSPINIAIDQQFPGFFSDAQRTSINSIALTVSGLSLNDKRVAQEILAQSEQGSIAVTNEKTLALAYFLNLGQTNIGMLLLANTMGFDLVNSMQNILQAYKENNLPRNFSATQTERFTMIEKAMSKNNLLSGSQPNNPKGNSSLDSGRGQAKPNSDGRGSERPGGNSPDRPSSGSGGTSRPSAPSTPRR